MSVLKNSRRVLIILLISREDRMIILRREVLRFHLRKVVRENFVTWNGMWDVILRIMIMMILSKKRRVYLVIGVNILKRTGKYIGERNFLIMWKSIYWIILN